MLLALDLASPVCTLALGAGPRLATVATRDFSEARGRALIAEVDAILGVAGIARAELRGVIAGTGPGSYTGLRIACAAARTLGWALRIPCGGLSSFEAAAFAAPPDEPVHVLLDAFRGEVYYAAYQRTGDALLTLVAPQVLAPADAAARVPRDARVIGDARFCTQSVTIWRAHAAPSAAELLALAHARGATADGAGVAALGPAEPLYLRPAAFRPRAV